MDIRALRSQIDSLNLQILELLSQRGRVVEQIAAVSEDANQVHVPAREEEMLRQVVLANPGPYSDAVIRHLFLEIFRASLQLKEEAVARPLHVSRKARAEDLQVLVGEVPVGGGAGPVLVAGPCSVESEDQVNQTAASLRAAGVRLLRGGVYKPRTSPYSFQGLGMAGLKLLSEAAARHGMYVVTEVMDPRQVEEMAPHVHLFQVGARNMSNFALLAEVGRAGRPVLLKRSMSATLQELLFAAEYIWVNGGKQIVLCERGIRTFETATRNTLDISAVPLLKKESHLPVLVDVSHALGRKDIVLPIARASLAVGADGLMVEVHPRPQVALSDAEQQLDLNEFAQLVAGLQPLLAARP